MKTLIWTLWQDDRGLVISSELVFVTCIVAIGMIVGLAAYRDGLIDELADNGRAIAQLNQSYSVAVAANPPNITVVGNVVTITRTFGAGANQVTVNSSFNNFSYTDTPDFCDTAVIQRVASNAANENDPPPAVLP